jgi:hypothetical protein
MTPQHISRFRRYSRKGQLAVTAIFFAAIAVMFITGLIFLASSFLQSSVRSLNKLRAFSIAEAGIEYYRWHLAHAPQDFMDGTGHAGPYVHNYYDESGNLIGTFTLTITPPPGGSTVVVVQSTGNVAADTSITKSIKVEMAIPSFAQYAWALNSFVQFGSAAQVYGTIQSNAGIHFNGTAHNLIESALTTTTDPSTGLTQWAVFTDGPPADSRPPTTLSTNQTVFQAGRMISVPAIDFTALTQNLSSIKASAQASGTYFASSTASGYDLALATSGRYTVYKVTSLVATPHGCSNTGATGWGTWSISTESPVASGTIPQNGNMFFEDNLWVRGQINNKRLTIASGRFPDNIATRSNITVNNSLTYTNFNGSDTIALIAQSNLNIGLMSDDSLAIDGALVAMNGAIQRYSYAGCGTGATRTSLTTDGMLASNLQSGFYYSGTDGYQSRSYNYDSNLLYGPPPSFPLSTNEYSIISWDEIQ